LPFPEQLPLVVHEVKGVGHIGLQSLETAGGEIDFLHFRTEEAIRAGRQAGDMDDARRWYKYDAQ